MTATILDGKVVAAEIMDSVAERIVALGLQPTLATVLVGEDPASQVYVRGKHRDAGKVGIRSIHHDLAADAAQAELEARVDDLNEDAGVDAILVQLPLPPGFDSDAVIERIDPAKDADGLHPRNLGRLVLGIPGLRPCTPTGVLRLLEHYGVELAGARVVVVGRSFLVGRPLALMLSEKGVDATVTMAHSRTEDLASLTRSADIVIAAAGVPRLLGVDHVRPGAVVVDVGINRDEGGLVGDVAFDEVAEIAAAITPVPGGVGPLTRALLMSNTLQAAEARRT
jgi:methylenetetrahydrofolate dehydrogenase (NADP+) / methenyltetrahydrofolate cyclohydrolase